MNSRMDKYNIKNQGLKRSEKNAELYKKNVEETPTSRITLLDNISEINVSKIKEMINSRENYQNLKKYKDLINQETIEEEDNSYDIYEDIDAKMYDINNILEEAKNQKEETDDNKIRKLKNTQYNILSRLDLKENNTEVDEETDFEENKLDKEETNSDLFDNLKETKNTLLINPIKQEDSNEIKEKPEINSDNTFYTGALSFSKTDFEEIHNLQSTVKSNNKLMKILIWVFIILLLFITGLILMNYI